MKGVFMEEAQHIYL